MEGKIKKGLDILSKEDGYLMGIDVNERTLTHRLGMYYQVLFPKWDVDCEYNKNGKGPKEVEFDVRSLLARMSVILRRREFTKIQRLSNRLTDSIISIEELDSLARQLENPEIEYDDELGIWFFILQVGSMKIRKTVIPDIIVHKRGRRNNYVAIEVKKTSYVNVADIVYDLLKLQALIQDKHYNYKRGIFISLPVSNDFRRYKGYALNPDAYEPLITHVTPHLLP